MIYLFLFIIIYFIINLSFLFKIIKIHFKLRKIKYDFHLFYFSYLMLKINFEMLINLDKLKILSVRHISTFQIRVTVHKL